MEEPTSPTVSQAPSSPHASNQKRQPRDKTLARHLEKRLLAYALAGTGAVTFVPVAAGEIIFTPTDITLSGGALPIDLDGDGTTDITLHDRASGFSSFYTGTLGVGGAMNPPGAAVLGSIRQGFAAAALPLGTPIGPESPDFLNIYGAKQIAFMADNGCTAGGCHYQNGPWANATNKFLGLRFAINGELHYGWARFTVSTQFLPIRARLTGYAYETEPGRKILAGDKGSGGGTASGDASLNPAPLRGRMSLGLLSKGASGLPVWRGSAPGASVSEDNGEDISREDAPK